MNDKAMTKAIGNLTHGVYVIGTHADGRDNLMTAAWLCQVSNHPCTIAVAVSKPHLTAEMIGRSGKFTVSVLRHDQSEYAISCARQSGRDADKTALVPVCRTNDLLPYIDGAASVLVCEVTGCNDSTDHMLFIAKVTDSAFCTKDALLYPLS